MNNYLLHNFRKYGILNLGNLIKEKENDDHKGYSLHRSQ